MKIFLIIFFTALGILYIVFSFIQVFKEKKDRKAIMEELKKKKEFLEENNEESIDFIDSNESEK